MRYEVLPIKIFNEAANKTSQVNICCSSQCLCVNVWICMFESLDVHQCMFLSMCMCMFETSNFYLWN
jgi:hypothetical protein